MKKENKPSTSVTGKLGRQPIRVKLQPINAVLAKAYPPDGESQMWWTRLMRALGTSSSDFVNASLLQLLI